MKEKIKNLLAVIMSRYIMSDHEVYKRVAQQALTAELLCLRSELRTVRKRLAESESNREVFKAVADKVTMLAMEVPDGEMTPFVHQAVIEVENGLRHVK